MRWNFQPFGEAGQGSQVIGIITFLFNDPSDGFFQYLFLRGGETRFDIFFFEKPCFQQGGMLQHRKADRIDHYRNIRSQEMISQVPLEHGMGEGP